MVIGYDAKKIIYDNDDTADYGQVMISALSEHYIHNHYMLYTPKAKENKRMASFSSRTTVHIKTPRHAIIGWKWRRGKGILHDAKRHGARIMHGLNGMLPAPLAHSHMHGVVSIPFTTFIDPAEQCPWLEKFFLTHDVERACRIAQRVITATATGKQMLVEHYGIDPDMIEVVLPACLESYHHNYTDNELKSIAHKYGLPQRFILFNGELTQQAGAQMMVEALNLLNDEDVKLVMIGKNTSFYQKVIKEFAHQHGIRHRIMHLDRVRYSDMPSILNLAKVAVLPVAGQKNIVPLAKAVSCRTPVVVADHPMAREVAGDAALYATSLDEKSFATAIDDILADDSHKRQELIDAATRRRMQFTTRAMADAVMGVYDKVCEHHHIK